MAVSRRHRARKRSLLLGDDFSIVVSPLWMNGRSGFWARRLSAFYGLFRSVFLIFSIRLHFPLLSALQMLAVFISSGSYHLRIGFFQRRCVSGLRFFCLNTYLYCFLCDHLLQNRFVAPHSLLLSDGGENGGSGVTSSANK